jgi:hypothetical protein
MPVDVRGVSLALLAAAEADSRSSRDYRLSDVHRLRTIAVTTFPRGRRKLTLDDQAHPDEVSFLAPPRTQTRGHNLPVRCGSLATASRIGRQPELTAFR